MEINTVKKLEKKGRKNASSDFFRLGIALFFMAFIYIWSIAAHGNTPNSLFLTIGAVFGAYMAMNIGANDVANNMGPAVGSRSLNMFWAIVIAAIFEVAGALIAGGEVVSTIKDGIIDPSLVGSPETFIWVMTAALLAGALWLNIATAIGAPVSTTHSIVGAILGAGVAAAGIHAVAWGKMTTIVLSWFVSPVLGGVVAALLLYVIKQTILHKEDMATAAKKYVPLLIAFMVWAFSSYLIIKGLSRIVKVDPFVAYGIGLGFAMVSFVGLKLYFSRANFHVENSRKAINGIFNIPLIFAAALLSFAHGANDVANAIGPLAAINDAVMNGTISTKASIPFWVMLIGGLGIALGLALYGPKLIKTVGNEITELDQIRAYAIALSAAVTVIIASQLGLPVSSTHIAIGGVFGVGFLREWMKNNNKSLQEEKSEVKDEVQLLSAYKTQLESLESKPAKVQGDYEEIVSLYKLIDAEEAKIVHDKKAIKEIQKTQYVKRNMIKKIFAAWIITVPVAAVLAAAIFLMIKGAMVP